MAKGASIGQDPAVSFFWNDWQGGTMTLSRHQKGCYMDLLCAQFNNGHLTTEEIKNVLGNDFANWGVLQKKFKQDSSGKWFNERLEFEIVKRKGFNKTRRENAISAKSQPNLDEHMGNGKGIEVDNNKLKIKVRENVFLKAKELETLQRNYPVADIEWMLDKLAAYKLSKSVEYASDYGAILSWVRDELQNKKSKDKKEPSKTEQLITTAEKVKQQFKNDPTSNDQ